MNSPHMNRLLAGLFPISIGITTYNDGEEFLNVDVWSGDRDRVESSGIIDVDYIESLVRGKAPDNVYDVVRTLPSVTTTLIGGGFRIRFQTSDPSVLEEFMELLSQA